MRKLASIRRVKELLPIKGADRIELAIIDGWQVVTQKGQHAVGDLVVYYEIDSFLNADDPRYESFAERFHMWGDKRGMRLKTIKLKKQLSQGLIMPVRAFHELCALKANMIGNTMEPNVAEGDDVTEILKIEKWEPLEKESTVQGPGNSQGKRFPAFVRKTDQERIQNYGALVERELDTEFEVTVKKDGSSLSVFRVDPTSPYYKDAVTLTRGKLNLFQRFIHWAADRLNGKEVVYGICSRNVMLPLEGNSNFHKAAAPVVAAMKQYDHIVPYGSYAVQGEVVAPDIQGNYEKVAGVELHVFDMFDIDKQEYVLPQERRCIVGGLGLNNIKRVDGGKLRDILRYKEGDDVVKLALTYATGPGDNEGVMREGVVFKADTRDFSFKVVSNEYLLHKAD